MKILLRLLLAALLIAACTTRAAAQVDAAQVVAIGRNVLAMDDYMLAIQYFNRAAAAKPYLWDPYYYRALSKLMLDDFHGAEQDASLAVERNKFKYEAYRVRGFARLRLGSDSLAIEDFDTGLLYSPDDKYFLFYKAIAQASMERYAPADSTFAHLLRLYPHFDQAWASRSQASLLAADTAAALQHSAQALRLSPSLLQPRLIRTDIFLSRADWPAAALELDSAILLSPSDASLYINRAYARYNNDDWGGAMADYNHVLTLEPDNYAALYNRALLRFSVRDMAGARRDFTAVLEREPDDFPARYNRALINMETGRNQEALKDLQLIAARYPRFYPVYYAMSRAHQNMGHAKQATDLFFKANDLIARYTANPRTYRLDRPTIQDGATRRRKTSTDLASSQTPEEVMEQFNALVTVQDASAATPLYGERLHGRVQDIDQGVAPLPPYALSPLDPTDELRPRTPTYPELADINASRWLDYPLYLVCQPPAPEQSQTEWLFRLTGMTLAPDSRPVDRLARACACAQLKDYEGARQDLDHALEKSPDFLSARLMLAYVLISMPAPTAEIEAENLQQAMEQCRIMTAASPRLAPAQYATGCVLMRARDWAGAADAFSRALEADPSMGAALYNRALTHLHRGDKASARADLSRAGELGVPAAYSLLGRL